MYAHVILDGHHRFRDAIDCGIEYVPVMRHLALTDEEKEGHAYFLNTLGRDISKREKQEAAVNLRRAGKSYRLIGEWLGIDPKTALNWTKDASEIPTAVFPAVGNVESADGKFRPSVAASAETLTEREETALRLREEGRTLKEIALAIGVSSPQTASNTLARAESKRVEIADEPDEEETHIPAKPAIDMRIFELIEYSARTAAEIAYIDRYACVSPRISRAKAVRGYKRKATGDRR
ncbi:hypothetical protein [Paenibacillus sp. B-A-8]|uniref:hypothetical protein n=1 Tax=Paenibacillus sp. B-A-8 TaxID=3400419 RepID=UPI003B0265D0